ncbi:MAG TPA: winged helix DNA-binding domain-containing protein [Candidatus Saccharimonadales bacterium]|nr:winged helix DNA-binding domain-containing protein [Candidatus Saccharimonadales bacterium]
MLDRRTLNRTLLLRQGLLRRSRRSIPATIESLVGLQAQEPGDPYVALWSRLEAFEPEALGRLLTERRAVRMGLMRTTLHLVTDRDALAIYPVMADVLRRAFRSSPFAKALTGVDLSAVIEASRAIVEAEPVTPAELGRRLVAQWPDREPTALGYVARFLLPLVQVPPRAVWGKTGRPMNTTLEAWLGQPLGDGSIDDVVRRYLAAFGPATVADIRIWSWRTGLREVVERLRPELRTFRDETGRELFDIEDGPMGDPDVSAPVRFLPQYDNIFLSHDDRSRILVERMTVPDLIWRGGVLVDGFVSGAWRIRREKRHATMTIELVTKATPAQRHEIEDEATRLFAFLHADADSRDVRIVDATWLAPPA